jgi:hypothetical protein
MALQANVHRGISRKQLPFSNVIDFRNLQLTKHRSPKRVTLFGITIPSIRQPENPRISLNEHSGPNPIDGILFSFSPFPFISMRLGGSITSVKAQPANAQK